MDGGDDLVAGADEAGALGQVVQDAELGDGEVDGGAVCRHHVPVRIDDQLPFEPLEAVVEGGLLELRAASQHRAHPRHEDAGAEGLDDVVVRADLEAGDDVGFLALGGHHHHRHLARFGPLLDAAADFDAADVGQHEVEDHQVRHLALHELDGHLAGADGARIHSLTLAVESDEIRDIGFVFDNQDAWLCHVGFRSVRGTSLVQGR